MNKPLVTVLLPVYNNPQINKCIDSVLCQTFKDFKLLIIDNASIDNTVDVIKQYEDSRIELIVNKENIGPTGSLNKGVNLIDTKYIARIDADDLMLPERLEKQVEFMENNPEFGIVGSWTRHIDENDNLYPINKLCTTDKGVRAYMMIQSPFYHPAVMLRTSVLKDNNLNYDLNIRVAVEYKLWNEILKYSKGCNLPEVLTYYRISANSLTNKNKDVLTQEYLNIREKICLENKQDLLVKSIRVERKSKKTLLDCLAIYNKISAYLNMFPRNDEDFLSLKSCAHSRIYDACTKENKSFYSEALSKVIQIIVK